MLKEKEEKKKKCGYIQWVTIHPLKNKEILSCATIQTNLESILLSEINQTKTNTPWSPLYVESKNKNKTPHRNSFYWLPEAGRWWVGDMVGELGEGSQKAQISPYKINKFLRCKVQHSSYSSQYCSVYLKVVKRVDLKILNGRKKLCTHVRWSLTRSFASVVSDSLQSYGL